jgi:hypothetical protein
LITVISIFGTGIGKLYSVKYKDDREIPEEYDALELLYDRWTNPNWLSDFFTKFKEDYEGFYGRLQLRKVVPNTINEADLLFETLDDCAENGELNQFFKPLTEYEDLNDNLTPRLKAYGRNNAPWLRLYAIKYNESFVITGGGIKLTKTMNIRDHLKTELYKLDLVRTFLDDGGELGIFEINLEDE